MLLLALIGIILNAAFALIERRILTRAGYQPATGKASP